MAKKKKKHLKNIAYLVSRNQTKQEIIKVIFPNGLEVGLPDSQFNNGFKVNGNAQVAGILNASDIRINGTSLGDAGPAVSLSLSPSVIPVQTSVTGGVADGEAATTINFAPSSAGTNAQFDRGQTEGAGDGFSVGLAATSVAVHDHDISSTAFVTADAFVGLEDMTYGGYALANTVPASSNTYMLQASQITGTVDTGVPLDITVRGMGFADAPAANALFGDGATTEATDVGKKNFAITGSVYSTVAIVVGASTVNYDYAVPIFCMSMGTDSSEQDLTGSLTFLNERCPDANPFRIKSLADWAGDQTFFDSVKIDLPFTVRTSSGTKNNVIRTFTISKQKKGLEGTDGTDGADGVGIRDFSFEIDIASFIAGLDTARGTADNGHYSTTSGGVATTDGPLAIGGIDSTLAMTNTQLGSSSDSTVDDQLNTLASRADFNGCIFYRVPAGKTLTIKRILGGLDVPSLSSLDTNFTLHVYETATADNGATSVILERLAQIKIDDSTSPINLRASGLFLLDTGELTSGNTVAASKGVVIVLHVNDHDTNGTATNSKINLTMEYTLS